MYGAIIGDLAGSIYEFNQTKKIENIKIDEIINEDSFYSDDTILTIAILDSILNNKSYDDTLRYYINKYTNYRPNFKPYFASAFSPNMIKWAGQISYGKNKGNGALMRISPVGYLFDTKEDIIKNAYLATIPSHNTKEAIDCGLWFLAEYENGQYKLNRDIKEFSSVEKYLKKQKRFKHLDADDIKKIENIRDSKWRSLREKVG